VKVCFVIPTLTSGGAERVAVTVLSALDARHERVLYLFSRDNAVYFDRIAPAVRVVVAQRRSWAGRMWELAMFLRTFRPDVVMPFLSYFITAVAVRVSGVRARVIFNQGTPTSGFLEDPDFRWQAPVRRRMFAVLTRMFYSRADAVVVTSAGVGDDLVANYGVPRPKIRVLHNPVDLEAITTAAKAPLELGRLEFHDPVVLAAGRLAGVKNYPLLIDAVAELSAATPVHAWILGEGRERAPLERMVRERGLWRLVDFLGFQANPWQYMAHADVFVLTSTYEGFGNVLIEAMACGTPVVATRSSGTAEIIDHGRNGLLVDHDPRAVAAAILSLITDRSLRERVVAAALEGIEDYATPRVAARYERLFEELAA
jgi:glycosyltransferase involved in cell wall biosynthesis